MTSHHQFVEQDEHSRADHPGPALVDIGLSAVSNIDLRVISHSALIELGDATGETAHLGVLRDALSVLFLGSVESDRVVHTSNSPRRGMSAHHERA